MDDGILLPQQQSTSFPDDARPSTQLTNGLATPAKPRDWFTVVKGGGSPNVVIEVQEEPDGTISQVTDDGSVILGMPAVHSKRDEGPGDFHENLAVKPGVSVETIAEEVIAGVEADIQSRAQWTAQFNAALELLGLKIEDLPKQGTKGNNQEISKANEPLLLEAMINYHAAAESEMLPAGGPVKVTTIGRQAEEEEVRALDFQDTFNYYLTEVATEFYPDTSRMIMHQSFCGDGFKKIFRCPIRRRPVSESVLALDLIVSENATDLDNALRVTHQFELTRSQLRRMQIVGRYRDVEIGPPTLDASMGSSAQREIKRTAGLATGPLRPEDMSYQNWETDVDIDIDYHRLIGKFEDEAPPGLPLPYKVTVERSTRQILGIWRNWDPADDLYRKRNMYVKFGMIPGLGFTGWGFMQILGNQTRNLRSMLRLLIAAGMFSNFPGGFKAKGARMSTNDIAPGPGEWPDVDGLPMGPGFDLSKYFMPLPYKEPSPVFIQLREMVKADAKRLGAAPSIDVGEGRANVPVGTILAMIEQQIQVMGGVHKRNHRAQKEEFKKMRDLFAENPSDLMLLTRERPVDSAVSKRWLWDTADQFMDLNLQPASDPNVPSQAHRIMLANVRVMLAQQFPGIFNNPEVARGALRAMGDDAERYVIRDPPPPPPDPKIEMKEKELAQKDRQAQLNAQVAGAKATVDRERIAADLVKAKGDQATRQSVENTKLVASANAPGANVPPQHNVTITGGSE